MHDNLFVVSRLGQLRNAQAFIDQVGSTNNRLAILYTDANLGLLEAIQRNIDPSVFSEVFAIRQPERPVSQRPKKNRIIYRQIEDLLVGMVETHGVANLYLCNVDAYYSFFEKVIADRGLNVTMTLLEEGLGTYANAGKRRYTPDTRADFSDVKHWGHTALLQAGRLLKALAVLAAVLVSWALRIDLARIREWSTSVIIEPQHRFGTISHFDKAYVYFPDKVYSNNLVIDEVNKLDFSLQVTTPSHVMDGIEGGLVVFVSQKYVTNADYFDLVLRILSEMEVERVLFKFHPRQSKATCQKEWDQATRRYPGVKFVEANDVQAVPVEELMMAGKVKRLIGLTSTALMYAQAFFPEVEVVSIGSRFKELAVSDDYRVSKGVLSEFSRDLDVFMDVSGVDQY